MPSKAPLGAYAVRVTNTDGGTSTCITCFAVIAAPTFSTLTPSTAPRGSVASTTLTGSGFAVGATVIGPYGVTFTNVTRFNSTTITATMTVSATAVTGTNLPVRIDNNATAGYGHVTKKVLTIT